MMPCTTMPFVALVRREFISLLRRKRSLLIVLVATGGAMLFLVMNGALNAGAGAGGYASGLMFGGFLFGVGLVGLFILPLFAALSITVERQRNTWDILRASPVSARAIVAGKTLSLLLFLLLVVVSMLPIVGVVFFYVGVGVQEFVLGLGGLLLWCLFNIHVGMAASATTDQPTTAIARTILFLLFTPFVTSVLSGLYWAFGGAPGMGILILLGALTAIAMIHQFAVAMARRPSRFSGNEAAAFGPKAKGTHASSGSVLFRRVDVTLPKMQGALIVVAGAFCALFAGVFTEYSGTSAAARFCEAASYPLLFVLPAIAARSLARDHEINAFDMLRMTLLSPGRILWHELRTGRAWLSIAFSGVFVGLLVIAAQCHGGVAERVAIALLFVQFALGLAAMLLLAECGALLVRHSGMALIAAYAMGAALPLYLNQRLGGRLLSPVLSLQAPTLPRLMLLAFGSAALAVLLYYVATKTLYWRHLRAQ